MSIEKLKKQLAVYAGKMAQDRLTIGASGNISARSKDRFYIKAARKAFENIRSEDFVGLRIKNPDPKPLKKAPSCEYRLHAACYLERPDMKAVFHTHPFFAGIVFSEGIKIKPVTMEFAAYISRNITSIKFISPGSKDLAKRFALACRGHDCIVMKKHGIVTLGKDMQDAYLKSFLIEREARAQVIIKLLKLKHRTFNFKEIEMLAGAV